MDEATLAEFKVEADELLDEAERCLLALERNEAFKPNYDSIFRVFHSLKGAAGMLNLDPLKEHMHKTENLFQSLKDRAGLSKDEIEFFLRAADCTRRLLNGQLVEFDYVITTKPLSAQTSPSAAAEPVKKPNHRPNVYVVDDEQELVDVFTSILKGYEFNVFGFTDPQKALEFREQEPPMAVLTDIHMPGMSGVELMRAFHQADPLLPVILVSGKLDKGLLLRAIQDGAFTIIEKPALGETIPNFVMKAVEKYQLVKLIGRTIHMVMYQFSDLDDFLASQKRDQQRILIRQEMEMLQAQYRLLLRKSAS